MQIFIYLFITVSSLFIKIFIRVSLFTGLWKGILLLAVSEYLIIPLFTDKIMIPKNFPDIYPIYSNTMLSIIGIMLFFTTLKNIIKIFNPEFNYANIYFNYRNYKSVKEDFLNNKENYKFEFKDYPNL